MSSKLLINESPLVILPSLAVKIGLNEAIVLQQIHYWLEIIKKSGDQSKFVDGHWWVYNTIQQWQQQFPFFSTKTVHRILRKLEDDGLIIGRKFNSQKWDQTKSYTINYERLAQLDDHAGELRQSDLVSGTESISSNLPDRVGKNDEILINTETHTENQTEEEEGPTPAADKSIDQFGGDKSKRQQTGGLVLTRTNGCARMHQNQPHSQPHSQPG